MYILLKNDLKKKLKSPIIWGLIIVILFISYIFIDSEIDKRVLGTYTGDAYDDSFYSLSGKEVYPSFENYEMIRSMDRKTYDIQVDAHDRIAKYYKVDSKEFNKARSFHSLVEAVITVSTNNPNQFLDRIFRESVLEIWDEVSEGVRFEDMSVKSGGILASNPSSFFRLILWSRHDYHLYKNDASFSFDSKYNHIEFTYRFLATIIPILLIVVSIITNYNNINKEVNEGSAKLVMTQSTQRWKYYLSKYLSGVIIVLFIIFVPLIITNVILGVTDGFQPLNYPVLYDKQGLTRFLPSFNFLEIANQVDGKLMVGISNVPRMSVGEYFMIQRNVNMIPYYQYILLTIEFILLFTLFLVAFVQLLSALINNQIISIASIIGIYGGAYILGKDKLIGRHYNLNPFTMHNSARMVSGTQNATMLTAAIILTICTIILLTIGIRYFKKKGI